MKHILKTWPVYFEAIVSGIKRFEVRNNDRDYHEGDTLILREWDPEKDLFIDDLYIEAKVLYLMSGGKFGIDKDYCVMGFDVVAFVSGEYRDN